MAGMRWGRRVASAIVLVGLVAIGLGRGVGAQTGPAFSAQIQLALRALLAGDQTITGNWTCSGTCSANAYRGQSTGTTIESYQQPPATPADPVLAGAGAGNVNNGTHRYVFTFSDSDGHETSPSAPTGAVTVTDNTTNGKVTVTVPYACNTLLPNQNIYRDFNGDGVFKLARAGAYDCMTSFVDNVANADLGRTVSNGSTALLPWTFQGDTLVLPDSSDFFGRTLFLGDRGAPDTFGGRSVGVSPVEYGSGQAGSLFLSSGSSPTSTSFAAVALYGAGAFREGAWLNTFNSDVVVNAAGTGSFRARVNGTERLNIIGDRMTGDVDFDLASHFQQFAEITTPAAPSANQGRLFLQDNGAGKSQLCVLFNSGAAQCFATEP